MKVLIISSRFPWPAYTGDRLRATIWLSALARTCEVTLVAPKGTVPADAPRFHFAAAKPSPVRGAWRAFKLLREGLPLQCLMSAPYDWAGAIARARRKAGPFDVTVVLLSRLHPWVRASLTGRTVLDAVDSLRRSAEERRKASGAATRWLWAMEERRMARLERETAGAYDQVVLLSEDELPEFDGAMPVTNGVPTHTLNGDARAYDFGFWGRFPYFANADATAWLLDEIWPAIRERRPRATMIVGGADAPRSIRDHARRRGVTLVSPFGDVGSFARNIRVALMPVRYGSGQSNKVLEAAEAGCAIVATPQALRGLAPLAAFARVETTADGFVRAALELLGDVDARTFAAERLRGVIETQYSRSATLDRLTAIVDGRTA